MCCDQYCGMANFSVPVHTESMTCQCVTVSKTQCSRKSKYRFVAEAQVLYSCGTKIHMCQTYAKLKEKTYFIEVKKNDRWVKAAIPKSLYIKDEEIPSDSSSVMSKQTLLIEKLMKQIAFHERTILDQKRTITYQKVIIQTKDDEIQELSRLKNDPTMFKLHLTTNQALVSALDNGTTKQLKFQLHPDKHPKELGWLFTEMFQIVNK